MSYLAVVALLAGCAGGLSNLGDLKIGDRPLFYKNQPGDSPETIENQAGRVGKKRDVPPAPARSAETIPPAAGGPPPAQVASRGESPGARERPAVVAQAASGDVRLVDVRFGRDPGDRCLEKCRRCGHVPEK